jgi:hypothetical protein
MRDAQGRWYTRARPADGIRARATKTSNVFKRQPGPTCWRIDCIRSVSREFRSVRAPSSDHPTTHRPMLSTARHAMVTRRCNVFFLFFATASFFSSASLFVSGAVFFPALFFSASLLSFPHPPPPPPPPPSSCPTAQTYQGSTTAQRQDTWRFAVVFSRAYPCPCLAGLHASTFSRW